MRSSERVGYFRLKGHIACTALRSLEERFWYKVARTVDLTKLDECWRNAVQWGDTGRSDEPVSEEETGVVLARSVRQVKVEWKRWRERESAMVGRPWCAKETAEPSVARQEGRDASTDDMGGPALWAAHNLSCQLKRRCRVRRTTDLLETHKLSPPSLHDSGTPSLCVPYGPSPFGDVAGTRVGENRGERQLTWCAIRSRRANPFRFTRQREVAVRDVHFAKTGEQLWNGFSARLL